MFVCISLISIKSIVVTLVSNMTIINDASLDIIKNSDNQNYSVCVSYLSEITKDAFENNDNEFLPSSMLTKFPWLYH